MWQEREMREREARLAKEQQAEAAWEAKERRRQEKVSRHLQPRET